MSSVASENRFVVCLFGKKIDRSSWKMLKTAEGMGDIVTAKSRCGIWPLYGALGMKCTVAESFGPNVRNKLNTGCYRAC
jgi:hypothetical protein